ncbi:hypothetical protein H0H81_009941 [Sphagnurus paluster]|uniref:RNA-dependent RNA polymerase n=1 Tax=Sphagnurus paluster TaxID=117069 RepID=A0A9P7GVY6_9AGAR|nr:hypothetical protein H0H81_009941 [Sphagnurus paluster]
MKPYVLREKPSKNDDSWKFFVPSQVLQLPPNRPNHGKLISFSEERISLQIAKFPENRVLRSDDPSKFILLSFGTLRFPDSTIREGSEYIARLFKAGLFLNGVQYRFYHHSNSQLRGRSCFVREAKSDAELDARIYALGDYGKIMNIAKRAKRIGLLFSEAQLDWQLDPQYIADIPDIKSGDEIFSDGCGLMSRHFAVQLSRAKKIIFRGARYTPCVFQIRYPNLFHVIYDLSNCGSYRYLGYKGVLMLHPDLDVEKKHLVQFRKSMKKFATTADLTFSLVNFSKPYSFGRLNNDVMVLLSSLGVTNEKLIAKQREYFDWIAGATVDPVKAVDFLCAIGQYELAERVLMDGFDNPDVSKQIRRCQLSETAKFRNEKARVASLHAKWVRASPLGALSPECQELNALHSQCVDGARIKIPDRLTDPPERADLEPYILDLLEEDRTKFADEFSKDAPLRDVVTTADAEEGKNLVVALLQSQQSAVSEYELFNLASLVARRNKIDMTPFLNHLDMSALSAQEKHALSATLELSRERHPYVWNSLIRSDILTPRDLFQRALNHPFSMQRLYSSKVHGLTTFFEYLRVATQEYTRKLLILKTEERFAIGIFMRGDIPWDEDPDVCYRLHISDSHFQLYKKHTGDTFIFINRPPRALGAEVAASIALQKISATVQRQIGRIRSTPVVGIELHVVSNRDRVAHQFFDLWFEHVPTEGFLPRFQRRATPYQYNELRDVDWEDERNRRLMPSFFPKAWTTLPRVDSDPPTGKDPKIPASPSQWRRSAVNPNPQSNDAFGPLPGSAVASDEARFERHTAKSMSAHLSMKMAPEINEIMDFAYQHHAEEEMFFIFNHTIAQQPLPREAVTKWMEMFPPLAIALLKHFPPKDDSSLMDEVADMAHDICRNLIRSANSLGIVVLVALEKIAKAIADMDVAQYLDLLMLTALSVRSKQLVQEVLLVLNDCRINIDDGVLTPSMRYGCKFALSIAFDCAEEAADECPCDDSGKPKRQRTPPTQVKLSFIHDDPAHIRAVVRVDAATPVRLHSHIRLQASSKAANRWTETLVLDGLVVVAAKGELKISLFHPAPPEMEQMDWNMYNAGIIATSRAMMDAVQRLLKEGAACCRFHDIITGETPQDDTIENIPVTNAGSLPTSDRLNESQIMAVQSCSAPLSLIWGPPGTGKTTVVVDILRDILKKSTKDEPPKILMTASTHNAVDNVLERFVALNAKEDLLPEQQILRVATDQSKVNDDLKHYTIDARVGGDTNENNRLAKKAQERVKAAVLVFTTCAG